MFNKIFILLIISHFLVGIYAQQNNLVKNGDFENPDSLFWYYTSKLIPFSGDEVACVVNDNSWINEHTKCWNCYNREYSGCENMFRNFFDTLRNGKKYVLLEKWMYLNNPFFWKYSFYSVYGLMESKLNEPLKANTLYQVSFDYRIVDFISTHLPTGGVGALFSEESTEKVLNKYPPQSPVFPQMFDVGLNFKKVTNLKDIPGYKKWYKVQGLYLAKGGEKYISISLFSDISMMGKVNDLLMHQYRRKDEMWKLWRYLIQNQYFVKNPDHGGVKCKYLFRVVIAIDNVSVTEVVNDEQKN